MAHLLRSIVPTLGVQRAPGPSEWGRPNPPNLEPQMFFPESKHFIMVFGIVNYNIFAKNRCMFMQSIHCWTFKSFKFLKSVFSMSVDADADTDANADNPSYIHRFQKLKTISNPSMYSLP